jgi:hypothetical protein
MICFLQDISLVYSQLKMLLLWLEISVKKLKAWVLLKHLVIYYNIGWIL